MAAASPVRRVIKALHEARLPCSGATRRQVDALKTVFGELPPMAGTIRLDGTAVEGEPAERRVRRGIGYVAQEHAVFAKLTVRENLLLGCVRQPDRSGMTTSDFFPKLAQRLAQTAGTLSAASARCWRSAAPCSAGRSC